MSKFQHDVMLRVVKILNVLMIELPFAACWFLYYSNQTYAKFGWKGNLTILGLFFVLYIALGKVYDAFWMSMQRVSELVYGQILGAMATDGILYIVICLMSAKLCNLLPGIAAIAGQLGMAAIWAFCAHKWYYKTFPPQKTAVVYDVRHGMEKLINEYLNGIKRTLNLFLINHVFVGTKPLACNMKRKLLRGIGCPVGDGTTIVGPIECKGTIAIGNNCWIGKNCKVNGNGTVQIGDNCDLGPEVTFQTGGHAIGDRTRRAGEGEIYHQVIGNGTWIGGRSTICNNSTVGNTPRLQLH